MTEPTAPAAQYSEDSISVLEGLEAIQKRPGMYIGSVDDDGVNHCIAEGIDNIVDEAMGGFGDLARIEIDSASGTVIIQDHGRGIPCGPHPKFPGKSTLEVALTILHAGGKMGDNTAYSTAGGLHGVGAKAVNALSSELEADVLREGKAYRMVFQNGKPTGPLEEKPLPKARRLETGTTIAYRLNPEIFTEAASLVPAKDWLLATCRARAYLNPGLRFVIVYDGEETRIHEPGGISSLVSKSAESDPKGMIGKKVARLQGSGDASKGGTIQVDVAICWAAGYRSYWAAYCNSVRQAEGGTHVTGLKLALVNVLSRYISDKGILTLKDKDLKVTADDMLEGAHWVVAIKHPEPVYKGQTKGVLTNSDAQGATQRTVGALRTWLDENQVEAKVICNKVIGAAKNRIAAAKARDQSRKANEGSIGLRTDKFADCSSKVPAERELLIVEGDSAGGSAKMGRDRRTQAVFPLKGKPLNTVGLLPEQTLQNSEISDLLSVISMGVIPEADLAYPSGDPSSEAFAEAVAARAERIRAHLAKVNFGKIIIMADADIDGEHIACLLLAFFFCHQRPLIEAGLVYIAQPPLYKVREGSRLSYLRGDAELAEFYLERSADTLTLSGGLSAAETEWGKQILEAFTIKIRESFDYVSSQTGFAAEDLSLAAMAAAGEEEPTVASLAEAISSLRRSYGWQAVSCSEVSGGTFLCRGLDSNDSFRTTVVDEEFLAAALDVTTRLDALFGRAGTAATAKDLLLVLRAVEGYSVKTKSRVISGTGGSPYEACVAVEQGVGRRLEISRLKGLGEMMAAELGKTTIDPENRTLLRVTVNDFDTTGSFIHDVMGKGKSEVRKQMLAKSGIENVDV